MDDPNLAPAVAARRAVRKLLSWSGGIVIAILGLMLWATMQDEEPPDVSDLMSHRRTVPPSQNAYAALMAMRDRARPMASDFNLAQFLEQPWNQAQAGTYLSKYSAVLAEWDTAVALPFSQAPAPVSLNAAVMGLSSLQSLWKLAALRAEWTARDGRPDEGLAMASAAAVAAARDLANADGPLILMLTGNSCRYFSLVAMRKIMATTAPSAAAIRRAITTMGQTDFPPSALEEEVRYEFQEMTASLPELPNRQTWLDDGNPPWGMRWFFKPNQTERLMAERARSDIAWLRRPGQPFQSIPFPKAVSIGRLPSLDNALGKWTVSRQSEGLESALRGIQLQSSTLLATITSLALCLYERDHGRLPPSLGDLVPDYLPALPLIEATGRPFDYDPTDRTLVIPSPGQSVTVNLDFAPPPPTASQTTPVAP